MGWSGCIARARMAESIRCKTGEYESSIGKVSTGLLVLSTRYLESFEAKTYPSSSVSASSILFTYLPITSSKSSLGRY